MRGLEQESPYETFPRGMWQYSRMESTQVCPSGQKEDNTVTKRQYVENYPSALGPSVMLLQ